MGYLNLVDGFIYKDPVFRAKLDALAENDAFLKDAGWNNSTKALFYQASAPTGWTKDTGTNDKFLRVTSGSGGGTGGTLAPSSSITLAHSVHTIPSSGNHTHDMSAHSHTWARSGTGGGARASEVLDVGGYLYTNRDVGGGSSAPIVSQTSNQSSSVTSGSGGDHNHGGATSDSKLSNIQLSYYDVIACSKNSGGGTYTDVTNEFHSGDIINFDPFVDLANNDDYLHARIMPASSVMIFGQASAPTGWTKQTSANDKLLRIVSGSGGGNGGSYAPSSVVTMTHTHTSPTNAGHTHSVPSHQHTFPSSTNRAYSTAFPEAHYVQADGSNFLVTSSDSGASGLKTVYKSQTQFDGSGTTDLSTDDGHTHTLTSGGTNWQLAYLDMIQCSKDSAGAPYTYDDLTSGVFAWKKLVSKQRLNRLAKNDEHILFHTPEAGTKAIFFMASPPITWTRLTAQHDKALRMVSGSSGGTSGGGAQLLSVALPLAHTHATSSYPHAHGVGSHTHSIDTDLKTANPNSGGATGGRNLVFDNTIFVGKIASDNNGTGASAILNSTAASSDFGDTVSHDHGTSGSALTDITLAYADVIYCSKD